MMHTSDETAQPRSGLYKTLWDAVTPILKVPSQPPSLPGNAQTTDHDVAVFPPAPAFLRYLYFGCGIVIAIALLTLLFTCIIVAVEELIIGLVLVPLSILFILILATIMLIAVRVRYDTTWYAITDRAVRIRRGIWTIRETTVSFENVQNVGVHQGPLERYFDIASVTIETAGSGSAGNSITNQAKIEGIRDAQRIRDLILQRLRNTQSTGLGDDDDMSASSNSRRSLHTAHNASPPLITSPAHVELLREIRDLLEETKFQ